MKGSLHRMDLVVKDCSYYVTLPNGKKKPLLKDVSAVFAHGLVSVLMGHSGAGYT